MIICPVQQQVAGRRNKGGKRLYGQHSDRGLPSIVTGSPSRTASAVVRTDLVASFV